MLNERQKTELLKLAPSVKFNEPLSRYTYFRIGGPAESFLRYRDGYNYDPLRYLLNFCAGEKIKVTILGGGSNVLVCDEGLSGLVLHLDTHHIQTHDFLNANPVQLQVSGGDRTQTLVKHTIMLGLTGLEPFLGLPGTVGGAIFNNSHYKYDQLFGNFVTKVWTIPLPLASTNEEHFYLKKDLKFSYDYSVFQSLLQKELIITAEIELPKSNKQEIKKLAARLLKERKNSQPLNFPSSGCIFKNPDSCTSAAELIDTAGLKGFRIGGAKVSKKHANFIINPERTATAQDVLKLIAHIKNEVLKRHGVELYEEVFYLDNKTEEENENV